MAKTNKETELAVAAALALATATQKTADSLAQAKVQSDIQAAIMSTKIDQIVRDVADIKSKLDEKYTTKEEHVILQKIVDGNTLEIRGIKTVQDTTTGKMLGIGTGIGAAFAVISLIVSHFLR